MLIGFAIIFRPLVWAEPISLQALVTPSTVILKDGHTVTFALHGFIEFKSLADMLRYVESQTHRWKTSPDLRPSRQSEPGPRTASAAASRAGVISMADERPPRDP